VKQSEEDGAAPATSPKGEVKNPDMHYGCSSDDDDDNDTGEDLTEEEKKERCDQAEAYKKEGNEFYLSGMYEDAIGMYTKALETAPLVGKDCKRKGDEVARQRCIYFANRAACHLAREEYEDAVEDCGNAIDLDKGYLKAYMRRATAFEHLEEYDRGLGDVGYIIEHIDPRNAFALSYKARITPLAERRREELKDEMMGKLKDLGNSILGNFGLSLDNFKAEQDPNTGSYSIKFSQE
jgi:tetratricopeptide (TPR) repeat protein